MGGLEGAVVGLFGFDIRWGFGAGGEIDGDGGHVVGSIAERRGD